MTRCKEFYDKWEQSPNWCEKCPDAVDKINKYLELVNNLEKKGIDRFSTFVGLPESVARPLLTEKNANVREKAIESVKNCLESKKNPSGEFQKKLTTGDIKTIINKLKTKEKVVMPLPDEKYNVILADPPWRYDFSTTENREIENQYPTMELNDICNLKVPAADDCILFLWATAPKLREALKVIESWEFEYKTNAIWDKIIIGMGYYFRGQHELLLVATKGNIGVPKPENRISSVIVAKREEHSIKPIIIYEIIEKMYPDKKYLEMFARNKRNNWASWGNEL